MIPFNNIHKRSDDPISRLFYSTFNFITSYRRELIQNNNYKKIERLAGRKKKK